MNGLEYRSPMPQPNITEYINFTIAQHMAGTNVKLSQHLHDERRHLAEGERDYWNRKADAIQVYELEQELSTKANKKDIPTKLSELTNDININSVDTSNFVDWASLNSRLANLGGGTGSINLSEYATKEYVTSAIAAIQSGGTIDLSAINAKITTIEGQISNLATQLSGRLDIEETRIKTVVESVLAEYEWLKKNFTANDVFNLSGWSDKLSAYLQSVGVVTDSGATWSQLVQRVNSISATVTAINESIGSNGEIDLESLRSGLEQYVDTEVGSAIANLGTQYWLVEKDRDEEKILKWLSSGFNSQSTSNGTFAAQYAATNNAVSQVTTRVNAIDDKIDTVEASISTYVEDEVENKISSSGLVTTSTLDGAVSRLFASNSSTASASNVKAYIEAAVTDAASNITISADNINLNGKTWADVIGFNSLVLLAFSSDAGAEHPVSGIYIEDAAIKIHKTDGGYTSTRQYTDIYPGEIVSKDLDGNCSFDFNASTGKLNIDGANIDLKDSDVVVGNIKVKDSVYSYAEGDDIYNGLTETKTGGGWTIETHGGIVTDMSYTAGNETGGGTTSITTSYNDNIASNAAGRYLIGTLSINGTPYNIYGKDTTDNAVLPQDISASSVDTASLTVDMQNDDINLTGIELRDSKGNYMPVYIGANGFLTINNPYVEN